VASEQVCRYDGAGGGGDQPGDHVKPEVSERGGDGEEGTGEREDIRDPGHLGIGRQRACDVAAVDLAVCREAYEVGKEQQRCADQRDRRHGPAEAVHVTRISGR
jgi:hypothetical protein